MSMLSIVVILLFHLSLSSAKAQTWVRVGYYGYGTSQFPVSDIRSALFTHLIYAFADVNSSSYQVFIPSSIESQVSTFTETVKQRNPSITTVLSIRDTPSKNGTTLLAMISNSSHRESFINSSINLARLYGFQGLDFSALFPKTDSDTFNMGTLFGEWRAAVVSEATNTNQSQLILTARVFYSPYTKTTTYPIESIQQHLNWVHIMSTGYISPRIANFTGGHTALSNPFSNRNTDYGISAWINGGLSANKLVLCFAYYGYAWTLVNPNDNGVGAPAAGPALTKDGSMPYRDIKNYIKRYGASVMYNATYAVNYCTIGTTWIGFDDVEAIRGKIWYAKEMKLLGYFAWQVPYDDDNWTLSQAAAAAQEYNKKGQSKFWLLVIFLSATAIFVLLGGFVINDWKMRKLKSKETMDSAKESKNRVNNAPAAGEFNSNIVPNLIVYSLADIEAATERFSFENKLGEGGYGPVYKGILPDGQEIAVKKLSKTSTQGFEEFKNEVMLTAKLQHINLVRLLGYCIDSEEQMLVYEYMPNKSLDNYLFDSISQYVLDWKQRVHIIEGITQGLLYLQEYSRLTIIHRDLKASNVLLDEDMKPKISDFGMARIFAKHNLEANTRTIVGTYGYLPPEYVKQGIYSTKSDVYSFGVLLLQIISGKRVCLLYGGDEHLSFIEYAYELWKNGKGMEFMDPSLDDTYSSCKLLRCLQMALLCVQENRNDRPSMLEISSMLKNETTDIMVPKKPDFLKQTDEVEQNKPQLAYGICSNNNLTVSELVPR